MSFREIWAPVARAGDGGGTRAYSGAQSKETRRIRQYQKSGPEFGYLPPLVVEARGLDPPASKEW